MKFDSEAEMLEALIPWLEKRGWEVFVEVESPRGYTDIVARKDEYLWGIEGKLTCNEKVVHQAEANKNLYHINSIAVPRPPNSIYQYYLKQHGLGCLVIHKEKRYRDYDGRAISMEEFDDHCTIETRVDLNLLPEMNSDPSRIEDIILHEAMKNQNAGTTGEKRVTRYKITVMSVQEFLEENGPSTLQEILDNVEMHWAERRRKYNLKLMLTDYEEHKFKRSWSIEDQEYRFENKAIEIDYRT